MYSIEEIESLKCVKCNGKFGVFGNKLKIYHILCIPCSVSPFIENSFSTNFIYTNTKLYSITVTINQFLMDWDMQDNYFILSQKCIRSSNILYRDLISFPYKHNLEYLTNKLNTLITYA